MPILTIESVDATANTLTITGHGLVTGDGPGAVRTQDGTLPDGLDPVTDYWVIRVDDDTLKIADSSANALANSPVDLLDAGDGTLYLDVGIPYRRARTYAALSQLKSADLNSIQDALVATHGLLTGQEQIVWTVPARTDWQMAEAVGNVITNITTGDLSGQSGHGVTTTGDTARFSNRCTIDIMPGDNITDLAILMDPSGAAQTVTVFLVGWHWDGATLSGHTVQLTITDPPAGMDRYDSSNATLSGAPYTVPANTYWMWLVTIDDNPTKVAAMGVVKDPPALV